MPMHYEQQDPEYTQGQAPGGKDMGADLPVHSVDGVPMRSGGYRPSEYTHPLPSPGSDDGSPKK